MEKDPKIEGSSQHAGRRCGSVLYQALDIRMIFE